MIAGSKPLHAALLLLLLSGCGYEGPELAGIPGLQTKVRAYYRDHATERNGSCRAPEMRGITQVDILEDNDDEMSIRVRYYFRDDEFGDIENGTGLGLANSREIVRRHGGEVRLAATGAEGSRFEIHLPARAVRRVAGGDS